MSYIKGVIAGAFDIIHPGYIRMFREAKQHCNHLVVMLHKDPSIERPEKMKPILDVWDRTNILSSLRFVDSVTTYGFEATLHDLLKMGEFDIRFLGDDYKDKPFTGDDLKIPIHYLSRDHGWSTTKYKQLIYESVLEYNLQR